MLTSMIFGGFYVQNLPPGLDWLKYFSVVRYIYYSMLIFEFDEDTRYTCSLDASAFSSCAGLNQLYANGTDISGLDHDLITGDDILDKYNVRLIQKGMGAGARMATTDNSLDLAAGRNHTI